MNENKETVQSYEEHIQEYIAGTPQEVTGPVKEWIDKSLELIPVEGKILELGSAFGRDAKYIEEKGYSVMRTDVTEGFVNLLQSNGYEAQVLDAITDELGGPYDMIFANAVFLHFNPDELSTVLSKAYQSLCSNGILVFSVKKGEGSAWTEDKLGAPRFFQYWQTEHMRDKLESHNFKIVEVESSQSEHRAQEWLHVIAQKSL